MANQRRAPAKQLKVRKATEVVAERVFDLENGENAVARLYRPIPVPRAKNKWACDYRIEGIIPSRGGTVYGFDGLQALLVGAEAIRLEMDTLSISFSFAGGQSRDTGIPRSIPIAFGLAFSEYAQLLIEEASTSFVESLHCGSRGKKVQRPHFFDSIKRRRN